MIFVTDSNYAIIVIAGRSEQLAIEATSCWRRFSERKSPTSACVQFASVTYSEFL